MSRSVWKARLRNAGRRYFCALAAGSLCTHSCTFCWRGYHTPRARTSQPGIPHGDFLADFLSLDVSVQALYAPAVRYDPLPHSPCLATTWQAAAPAVIAVEHVRSPLSQPLFCAGSYCREFDILREDKWQCHASSCAEPSPCSRFESLHPTCRWSGGQGQHFAAHQRKAAGEGVEE